MTKSLLAALAATLVLLAVPTPAAAHGAAPPPSYLTRLLSDHSDDWLGVQDGHNLIALDAYPAYNASLGGDVLVLRLVMDGGYARAGSSSPELAEHITFKAAGKEQELAIHTEDNQEFSSELGFQAVRGPFPQLAASGEPDGERFFVEGLVRLSALGVKAGDALTDFFVTGEAGDGEGDLMPQGLAPGYDDPMGVGFDIGTYTLPGVDTYAKATPALPAGATVPLAGTLAIPIEVRNLVKDTAQTVTARASGSGLVATFGSAAKADGSVDVPANGTGKLDLQVAQLPGGAPASATLTLEVTTSLGGHQVITLPLKAAQPPPPATNTTAGTTSASTTKSSPAAGLGIGAVLLAAAVVARRRW
jgi:hypothetical protein